MVDIFSDNIIIKEYFDRVNHYFEKMLRELGIEDELRRLGVKEGDSVKVLEWEFEWYE